MKRCPTCGHWWLRKPRWYQLWRWPVYWSRCPFLDIFETPYKFARLEQFERDHLRVVR